VVVVGTTVVAGVGSTVVVTDDGSTVVAGTVVAGTVVAGTVVAGTVIAGTVVWFVNSPEVVEVGRIVVVGGGAGRASTSTRSPWGNTCRSTSVTAALAT
jgi:hypothetical protein